MVWLRTVLRGLWFRRVRALVLFAVAVIASGAAILGPAYGRAVEQSVLANTLDAARSQDRGVVVNYAQRARFGSLSDDVGPHDPRSLLPFVRDRYTSRQFGEPVPSAEARDLRTTDSNGVPATSLRLAWRDGVCGTGITVTAGRCPDAPDEVVASAASAARGGFVVGRTVRVTQGVIGPPLRLKVVGLYQPVRPDAEAWMGHDYFDDGDAKEASTGMDVKIVPSAGTLFGYDHTLAGAKVENIDEYVDVPLRPGRRLDDIPALRGMVDDPTRFTDLCRSGNPDAVCFVRTELDQLLDDVATARRPVGTSTLLATVTLVLLASTVLYVAIGATTEERQPELALMKLRGFGAGWLAGFAQGEAVLLTVLAAPVGLLLGWLAVRGAAGALLGEGVPVGFTPTMLGIWAAGVAGAVACAALAGGRLVTAPIATLLRQVPNRTRRWQASSADLVLLVLAVVATAQVVADRRSGRASEVSLAAPVLLGVLAGMTAARLLPLLARRRTVAARRKGRPAALLAWAAVGRRRTTRAIVVVTTTAVTLAGFGIAVSSAGDRAWTERATWEIAADRSVELAPVPVPVLLDAVDKADPNREWAAPVVIADRPDRSVKVRVVAVDTARLAASGVDVGLPAADVRKRLSPKGAQPVVLAGPRIGVELTVEEVDAVATLAVLLRQQDGSVSTVQLGDLTRPGPLRLEAGTAKCTEPCTLAGFVVRTGTATRVRIVLKAVTSAAGHRVLPGDAGLWAGVADLASADPPGEITAADGVRITVQLPTGGNALNYDVRYKPAGGALPVLVSGPAIDGDRRGRDFQSVNLYGGDQDYRQAGRVTHLPAGSGSTVFADLRALYQSSSRSSSGALPPESRVWLSADAPADAVDRLRAAGLPVTAVTDAGTLRDGYAAEGPGRMIWLYLAIGLIALLLAAGMVFVVARSALGARGYEQAALGVAGLSRAVRRRAVAGEYLTLLGTALVSGTVGALVCVFTVLPAVPVHGRPPPGLPAVTVPSWWPVVLVLVGVAAFFGLLAAGVVRGVLRSGGAARLREGNQ